MTTKKLFVQSPQDWVPRKYMKKGMEFLLTHNSGALFFDPGLGKTSTTLGSLTVLKKKKMLNKVLIIAPLRVCHSVWPREIMKWIAFNHFSYVILHGPNKDLELQKDVDVYIINPEGLDWLLQVTKSKSEGRSGKINKSIQVDVRRFKKLGFDILVIDELTKFKNHASDRFKMLNEVAHTFRVKWGLTGSPTANGLLGLFGQCKILDGGRSLGKFVSHYKKTFFEPVDEARRKWVPKLGAAEEIYKRVSPLALRMAAEDWLEMPKLIPNKIMLEMPPVARKIYDAMEEDLLTMVEGNVISAFNAGVASGKCRQIASGAIYLDPEVTDEGFAPVKKSKRDWKLIHEAKVDALEDLVEELNGSPLLVGYEFNHDLERIQARLGKDIPYIGKGVSVKRCNEIEDEWNAGNIPVLLGHPQSMGHGLNFQESGNHVCLFTTPWDFELYDQFIRRVLRSGNTHSRVFLHLLMMEDTVDELVYMAIIRKNRDQQSFFKALVELAKKRRTKNK